MVGESSNTDLWLFDLQSGSATPFSKKPGAESIPSWLNPGNSVVFNYYDNSGVQLLTKPLDGAVPGQVLFEGSGVVSTSGKYLLVGRGAFPRLAGQGPGTRKRGYVSLADGGERNFIPFPEAFQRDIVLPALSPDDRWLAY